MPDGARTFEIDFDFIDHELRIDTERRRRSGDSPLAPRPVADFYRRRDGRAAAPGRRGPHLDHARSRSPTRSRSRRTSTHAAYDPERRPRASGGVLVQADRVLKAFRGRFIGKCSPVHFFWGSFDLAVTRFSGRRAPPHPGAPNVRRLGDARGLLARGLQLRLLARRRAGRRSRSSTPTPTPSRRVRRRRPSGRARRATAADLREFLLPYAAVRAGPPTRMRPCSTSSSRPTRRPPTWRSGTGPHWNAGGNCRRRPTSPLVVMN